MSFSNLLQDAQNAQKIKAATPAKTAASSASVMTLGLDDPMTNSNSLMPYNDEEEWTLSSKYETTEKNVTGKRYSDDNYSTVDEKKNVKIDPSQINLTQESNSQYIPFIMPRYFDGIDLMNMTLLIYYLNANGAEGWSEPINVCYNSTHIRFGWVLTDLETAIQGKLTFEIHAKGKDPLGGKYLLKTRPNSQLEVLESLHGNGAIIYDETWSTSFLDTVEGYKEDAEQSALLAGKYLNEIVDIVANAESDLTGYSKTEVNRLLDLKADLYIVENLQEDVLENTLNISKLREDITTELLKYYTKEEIDKLFEDFDISDQLVGIEERVTKVEEDIANFDGLAALRIEFNEETKTLSFYNGEETIANIVLNISSEEDIANALKPIEEDLQNIHKSIDDLPNTLTTDYYTKDKTNELLNTKADKTQVNALGTSLDNLSNEVSGIDKSPRKTYDVVYNDVEDPNSGENVFVFYEIENEEQENEVRTLKKKFTITGGSGGGSSSVLKIIPVTQSPVVATVNDKVEIVYEFSGVDSSDVPVTEGDYEWRIGNKVIATGTATNGRNIFDVTPFASTTEQRFTLTITDENNSSISRTWKVQLVDVRLVSNFNDAYANNIGEVSFDYIPYGAIQKEVHFILDGEEIGTVTTSSSGIPTSYTLPSQTHGSHLLEVYMTATINNTPIESNHIFKDIIWFDSSSNKPVIGCANQTINITQYNTVNIKYSVIDPNTETPKVTWYLDGEVLSEEILTEKDDKGFYTYPYKANEYGTFVFTITCGEAEPKKITLNVEELDIDVNPVTAGLAFDFNPIGYSNSSKDRLWSYNDVTMTVSDNFDWVNGGYQVDENGDQYFCVKAGTNAMINYNLFADDPKKTGKEFKVIFRTKNIRKRDTSFLTCIDENIGLDMKVEDATVYNSGGSLKSNYCEDTIIEYEFNINKDTDMMVVMTYEDGTPGKPCEYTSTSSFKQSSPKPITIGSADCDIHIYRMKAYSISLTDTDIKNNFIADARNADEMLARYNRNQIYTDGNLITTSASGDFNVDALMKAAPDLRYIFLEVPQFTNDKDNKIDGCTVYFRYPNGTRPHDNWTCTGMRHRGQGTSSNLYGYAGRNIDLCMDRSTSLFTWIDEEGNEKTSSTITLTDTSYPTDYLNIKVNIASSENANNAEFARRFNEFQPFLRYARKKDSRIKDTMEFYNCVVFIRETSENIAVDHREFNDTNWHKIA